MAKTQVRDPVPLCARCDQPHLTAKGYQACAAHLTRRRTAEGGLMPCTQPKVTSLEVCRMHGANSPQSRAKAARAKAEAATRKAVQIFGVPRQVDPAQGLIEEYWRSAGLVTAYERIVTGVDVDDVVWGMVERHTTTMEEGTSTRVVSKGAVNTWVQLFNQERDRFAKLGVEIVRLGLEARRDEYIRAQVEVFAAVLLAPELALTVGQRRVAAGLLRGLGATETRMIEG
jgi:hypothetical protein